MDSLEQSIRCEVGFRVMKLTWSLGFQSEKTIPAAESLPKVTLQQTVVRSCRWRILKLSNSYGSLNRYSRYY